MGGDITSSNWGIVVNGSITTESEEEEGSGVLVNGSITSFASGVIVNGSITAKS